MGFLMVRLFGFLPLSRCYGDITLLFHYKQLTIYFGFRLPTIQFDLSASTFFRMAEQDDYAVHCREALITYGPGVKNKLATAGHFNMWMRSQKEDYVSVGIFRVSNKGFNISP